MLVDTGQRVSRLFVLVPSLSLSGPIKGAVALCNAVVEYLPVTLVALKSIPQEGLVIDPRVNVLSLANVSGWKNKCNAYQGELAKYEGDVVSLSICLSADVLNFFVNARAKKISSVRGNLPRNYRHDYGRVGNFIAFMHYLLLKRFDCVIAMSAAMEKQLRKFGLQRLEIIGNFVDEPHLERQRLPRRSRDDAARFVFLGTLSTRKRPDLLIRAMRHACDQGIDCYLDIVGDGPLRDALAKEVSVLELDERVTFHGHVETPYAILQKSDCMVLPSESEGISRAVLEALFFGIPCILRDVDANRELIRPGSNGELFCSDEDFIHLFSRVAQDIISKSEDDAGRINLLPAAFRRQENIQRFVELLCR